jgi:uncharacterized iron-regulated membrane protein
LGDYGGWPLKLLWAMFDVVTIVVLVSGLYLLIVRRKLSVVTLQGENSIEEGRPT